MRGRQPVRLACPYLPLNSTQAPDRHAHPHTPQLAHPSDPRPTGRSLALREGVPVLPHVDEADGPEEDERAHHVVRHRAQPAPLPPRPRAARRGAPLLLPDAVDDKHPPSFLAARPLSPRPAALPVFGIRGLVRSQINLDVCRWSPVAMRNDIIHSASTCEMCDDGPGRRLGRIGLHTLHPPRSPHWSSSNDGRT